MLYVCWLRLQNIHDVVVDGVGLFSKQLQLQLQLRVAATIDRNLLRNLCQQLV